MRSLLILCVTILLSLAVGQGLADTIADQLNERLAFQRSIFPQEKVHVMTDRELYQPGDTIWMRAWVVDGETFMPFSHGSRYVYVELIDGVDSLRQCVKLLEREGRFVGQLVIPQELKSGDYTLAAFTYYNLSGAEDFLFKKIIHVITPSDAKKGYTARALFEGFKPDAPVLTADPGRPYYYHHGDTLMRVTFSAPDSTWLSISLTDDCLTPTDTTVTLARRLTAIPDLFTLETLLPDSQYYRPVIHYERRQGIAGLVRNVSSKQVNTIVMIDMNKPAIYTTYADNHGNFSFHDNISFTDNTMFAFVGFRSNGGMISDIQIADYTLPKKLHHLPSDAKHYYLNRYREDSSLPTSSDVSTIDYKKDSVKLDNKLKEILDAKDLDDIYTRLSNESRYTANLSDYKFHNLKEIVLKFDGIYFDGDVAMYKEEGFEPSPVRFVVRNKEFPIEKDNDGNFKPQTALKFPVEVIYAVDFINPDRATSLGKTDYPDSPIVRLDLKNELELIREANSNPYVKLQKPLGYTKPLTFPNLRVVPKPVPTRYWNPAVYTGRSGQVTLELPIPTDYHTTYTLRAEGITRHGEPVSIIYRIEK
ncbi:MAG: hypothetical protein IKX59_09750 [Bacteroidales bacterium]|nr:hypothetical protein [Bacteroidales bacterium]